MDRHCRNCKHLQAQDCPLKFALEKLNETLYKSRMFEVEYKNSVELKFTDTMMDVLKVIGEKCKEFVEGEEWVKKVL